MKTIRCAGVPEHFNYPWQLALQSGDFQKAGINVVWNDEGGGTGAMAKALADSEIDLAIMLTEGAVTDIVKGASNRIVSGYVQSPLTWGVHTSAKGKLEDSQSINGIPFAISRINSGSHLMAFVYGRDKGLALDEEDFNLVQNLDGARHALKANPDQLFLWEKYTTKPLVDSGEFKIIDHCPTPWPSFVVVVREAFLDENEDLVNRTLDIVAKYADMLKIDPRAVRNISSNYHLLPEDAAAWFATVEWSLSRYLDVHMLVNVTETLSELGILERKLSEKEVYEMLLCKEPEIA